MEKMVYERPVMRVEAFQANDYVAACKIVGTNNVLDVTWEHADKQNDDGTYNGNWGTDWNSVWGNSTWENSEGYDTTLHFSGTSQKGESLVSDNYYWTTTESLEEGETNAGKAGTYYLQYSGLMDALGTKFALYYEDNGRNGLQHIWAPGRKLDSLIAFVTMKLEQINQIEGS